MSNVVLLVLLPFAGALIAQVGRLVKLPLTFSVLAALPLAGMGVVLGLEAGPMFAGEQFVYALGGWPQPQGIALNLDGLAWLSSVLIVAISTMVALAALSVDRYRTRFFFFLMLLVAGMEIVVLTGDLFTMFVGFEIVAIAAYVLIAFDQTDQGLLASLKYLILSTVGILFFLFGVFLIYRDFGVLSLNVIAATIDSTNLGDTKSIHFALAALCVGIGVRTAFIPFHTWLPEAHAYAPHPISAILSGALIKVSFLAMIRILLIFRATYFNELLLWIGAGTALIAVVWALSQRDAKRLLAYHSISQMGYILAAFGAASAVSLTAAYAHALHHALFKSLLFLVAGTAIHMTGTRDLYAMPPIGRRAPILAGAFIIGALSIAGIPPFNGFASKQLISTALHGHPAYVLLWITAVGTIASFIKISRIVMPGPRLAAAAAAASDDAEPGQRTGSTTGVGASGSGHSQAHVVPAGGPPPGFLIHVPVVLLALACIATGIFAPEVANAIARLLASGVPVNGAGTGAVTAAAELPESFFTGSKLLGTLPILGLGIGLYLLAMTPAGKRIAKHVEGLAPQLRTVLLFFVFGLVLFAVLAYL